jgi:3-hydroxyacyl-CoA dehydrogenase/enoyl-CoA hydratase/3-hydroxybutyryl-CoA epimerase
VSIDLEVDAEGVARLWLGESGHAPPSLSPELLDELDRRVDEVEDGVAEGHIHAVVLLSRTPAAFLAGSDLRPLRGIASAHEATRYALGAQRVLRRVEELPVPTIAVVEGACLGGGFELALACAYRIASDSARTRLALPEVRTGLIPGFGGTVRLPRLVGLQTALEIIVTGRPVGPAEALRIGLVDEVVPAHSLHEAVERFARDRAAKVRIRGSGRRRVRRRLLEDTAPGRRLVFLRAARRLIPPSTPPAAAPRRALDAVAEGVALALDPAFRGEAKIFGELAVSPDAQALIHTQLLLHSTAPPAASDAPLEQAAVLGAGEVGSALAYLLARAGIQVRVKDRKRSTMAAGVQAARDRLAPELRPSKRRAEAAARAGGIAAATGFGGFGTADLVAVAVGDRAEASRRALREVEDHTRPECLFALTSPLISVASVQRALTTPERVVGFHLAEPVARFPLVEVVPGPDTDSGSLARALDLARRIGRTPVVVADRPGFLLPRLLGAYFAEALRLLDEGATVRQIDAALESAGFAAGPFHRMDAIGRDRSLRLLDSLTAQLDDRFRPAPVAGRLRGTRDGFYLYRNGRPITVNPTLPAGLADLGEAHAELIRDRVVLLLVNEGALALEEAVADPDAIDLTSVLGVGFPRLLGGGLHFAAGTGAPALLDRFARLARFGPRFAPAPLLHQIGSPEVAASGHPASRVLSYPPPINSLRIAPPEREETD